MSAADRARYAVKGETIDELLTIVTDMDKEMEELARVTKVAGETISDLISRNSQHSDQIKSLQFQMLTALVVTAIDSALFVAFIFLK